MRVAVGAMFKLKRSFPPIRAYEGNIGYVFEVYPDFDDNSKFGAMLIFESGGYDGFSNNELEEYCEFVGVSDRHNSYEFKHVFQVFKDFNRGFWTWPIES